MKTPLGRKNYVKYVIGNANLERNWEDLKFEIGYSFTEETFRKNGISKELKLRLLKSMKPNSGILFSTTAITSSKNFFLANGFSQLGQAYDGENDKGIMYYEITL